MSLLFNIGLGPLVLKHLNIKELVAVERVSHQWQADVLLVLRKFTLLAVADEDEFDRKFKSPPWRFCFERGLRTSFVTVLRAEWTPSNLSSFISKLPNLEAFYYIEKIDLELFKALAKCSKLSHVGMPRVKNYEIRKLLRMYGLNHDVNCI